MSLDNKINKNFPFLETNPNSIYFDNGATTLKPINVINAEKKYYEKIAANPHTNDYSFAFEANEILKKTRKKAQKFINAKYDDEIIFTSGATQSLNQIAFGLEKNIVENDEIFVTTLEHSSNLLPWIIVAKRRGAIIKKIPLNSDTTINIDALIPLISNRTKVVSFASVSNTIAASNDVENIVKKIHLTNKNVIVNVDVAQSIGHEKTDVQKWDADFISFSMHKMYGPFGVGILYGKKRLLKELEPLNYGGGMSNDVSIDDMTWVPEELPAKLEAGTPNISGIYASLSAFEFIEKIGIENIKNHEIELKRYARDLANKYNLENKIEFYNIDNDSPIILFNVKGINPQDISTFLANDYNIYTRSGSHCSRVIKDVLETKVAVRASFALYNTKKEIEEFILALKNSDKFLDYLF